jgi:hypothetical protein
MPFQTLAVGALFLAKPRLPVFFFSVLELPGSWKYAFFLLEISATWLAWVNCMFYISILLTYFSSTTFWLRQIW